MPFWHSVALSPFAEYPHNRTYSTATLRCLDSLFLLLPKLLDIKARSFHVRVWILDNEIGILLEVSNVIFIERLCHFQFY